MGSLTSMCDDLVHEQLTTVNPPMFWDTLEHKDTITEAVINDLNSRSALGIKKYNTTLGENNHQNMLQHMYEELLDAAQYCKKEIHNIHVIQDLIKKYPNDNELGYKIREIFS
jgi:hypothetical protein